MTPREKAKELVDRFIPHTNSDWDLCDIVQAQQYALIAVEEAEKSEYNVLTKFGFVTENYKSDYWQLVKDEIELL